MEPVDGLVVGEVFARPEAVAELAPEAGSAGILDEASIDRRAARWVRRCWGPHFVAWPRPDGAGVAIYREAGGAREALVWSLGGLTVITSGLDAPGLETLRPRLDIRVDRIAAFLGDPSEIGGELALNAVTAIAPGRLWRAGGGSRTVWSPSAFAAAPFADGVDDLELETEFSTTIRRTLTAVADLDRPLLAEISGGLDSAMMAWGLSGRSQVRRWLHVHAGPLEADERRFALAIERV